MPIPRLSAAIFLLVVLLFCAPRGLTAASTVSCQQSPNGKRLDCTITQPTVNAHRTEYRAITFQPRDKVLLTAGGCVQTGGAGRTWKRYVNPGGPNSDRLYHGLVSIPGVTGPDLVRIQGYVGRWLQLPPSISPAASFLVLGYEDDDYGDNGYWGHDDGTGDQCKQGPGRDGGPAWVKISIDRGSGTIDGSPAPFDLVMSAFDPTGIPVNPAWGWEKAHPGDHPNASTLCDGFPYLDKSDPSKGVALGTPPCTTQSPSVNAPEDINNVLCAAYATPDHLHGHLNWFTATYTGTITWTDHKDWTQRGDDDYDFTLAPDTSTGLTASNLKTIGLEFDSDETVDQIDRGWWNDFHQAVDANDGRPGGQPGAMIDGHQAVVVGLVGLDSEHGAYSELHPVYGMAIHLNDDPNDDQWSILARNWGDEGFCSQDEMAVPVTTLSFFVPRPNAIGGTANTDEVYGSNDNTIAVTTQRGGATVTIDLGAPERRSLVEGLVHFKWTMNPNPTGTIRPPVGTIRRAGTAARGSLAVREVRPGVGPEDRLSHLIDQLPPEKRAEVNAQLKKKPPAHRMTMTKVRRLTSIPVTRATAPVRARHVPNPERAQRDRERMQILCAAYGGHIPGAAPGTCR